MKPEATRSNPVKVEWERGVEGNSQSGHCLELGPKPDGWRETIPRDERVPETERCTIGGNRHPRPIVHPVDSLEELIDHFCCRACGFKPEDLNDIDHEYITRQLLLNSHFWVSYEEDGTPSSDMLAVIACFASTRPRHLIRNPDGLYKDLEPITPDDELRNSIAFYSKYIHDPFTCGSPYEGSLIRRRTEILEDLKDDLGEVLAKPLRSFTYMTDKLRRRIINLRKWLNYAEEEEDDIAMPPDMFDEDLGPTMEVLYGEFQAQSINPKVIIEGILEFFKNAINKFKDKVVTGYEIVKEKVGELFNLVKTKISGLIGFVSQKAEHYLNVLLDKIFSALWKMFDPWKCFSGLWNTNTTASTIIACIFMVISFTCVVQILGFSIDLFCMFLDGIVMFCAKVFGTTHDVEQYLAQGVTNETGTVLGKVTLFLTSMFGSLVSNPVANKIKNMMLLISAGTIALKGTSLLLVLLPVGLREAIKTTFATPKERAEMEFAEWNEVGVMLIRTSRIPQVLSSPEFRKRLNDCLRSAPRIRSSLERGSKMFSSFNMTFANLVRISSIVEQFVNARSTRMTPFSFHLCSLPGVGKTVISSRMIEDITGFDKSTIYYRPIQSDYFDGYINQQVIVYDEFLVGSQEVRESRAREYLGLISPGGFVFPMASVDNAVVGIKGTEASNVRLVASLSNRAYDVVPGIDSTALQRRRNAVIIARVNPEFNDRFPDGIVDIGKLSAEEVGHVKWLQFSLIDPVKQTVDNQSPWFDYELLVVKIKKMYEDHLDTAKIIDDSLNKLTEERMDPKEIIEDALRDMHGIPNKPVGVMDYLTDLLGFSAQAGSHGYDDSKAGPSREPDQRMDVPDQDQSEGFKTATGKKKRRKTRPSYSNVETSQGYKEACIERTKVMREPAPTEGGESSEDSYQSADDVLDMSADLVANRHLQKEYVADALHTNVEPLAIHRHLCLGCGRHFAHKHANIHHDLRCKECEKSNFTGNLLNPYRSDVRREDGPKWFDGDEVIPHWMRPEFRERLLRDYSQEERISIGKWLLKENCYAYVNAFKEFIHDDPQERVFEYARTSENYPYTIHRISVATWVKLTAIVFLVVKLAQRFFYDDDTSYDYDEVLTFKAQSERPQKQQTAARTTRFTRGLKQLGGQGSNRYDCLIIDGLRFHYVPLVGRKILTFGHAMINPDTKQAWKDGQKATLIFKGTSHEVEIHHELIVQSNEDYVIVTLYTQSKGLPQFKDIVKQFVSEDQLTRGKGFSVSIENEDPDSPKRIGNCTIGGTIEYSYADKAIELSRCLKYSTLTVVGDCGSKVVAIDGPAAGRIVGIHVAGRKTTSNGPLGVATIVTREDLKQALEIGTDDDFAGQGPTRGFEDMPSVVKVRSIPLVDQVFITRRSKIQKSALAEHLPWKPKKEKPLLRAEDPRCELEGDPAFRGLAVYGNNTQKGIDRGLLEAVKTTMTEQFVANMHLPIGTRQLTLKECIGGVPGVLASVKTSSSAGWPLAKVPGANGKKRWIWFDEHGEACWTKELEYMFDNMCKKVEEGEEPEHRWLAFLKDELMTTKKIKDGRTRLIFSGALVDNLVLRKYYGWLLAAFNNASDTTAMAIGINQYSHDMQTVYDWLRPVGKNFGAGDYKGFDQHIQKAFRDGAYDIIRRLSPEIDENIYNYFFKHETEAPIQLGDLLVQFECVHASGCLFTTPINCLVNEMYLRYVFCKMNPGKRFDEHVRIKVLGDDHIICYSDEVRFGSKAISEAMVEVGQEYTMDSKEKELSDEPRTFSEISFLGAIPRRVQGKWCGALKKETLEEVLLWTRDSNQSIVMTANQMLECASVWEQDYFLAYKDAVKRAMEKERFHGVDFSTSWEELRVVVANRTAQTGCTFVGQAPTRSGQAVDPSDHSLTTFQTLRSNASVKEQVTADLMKHAVKEQDMNLTFGTDSNVFRQTVNWTLISNQGAVIWEAEAPFGLLKLGNSDNIQNMPFDRFVFWHGQVSVTVQVNGIPFANGLLVLYYMPLLPKSNCEVANWTANQHVMISPNHNTTATLTVPFRFFRSVINTNERTESLGVFRLAVLSRLRFGENNITSVQLRVYSSFPESKFSIPRPLRTQERSTRFKIGPHGILQAKTALEFKSEGQTTSSVINNTYEISGVVGEMPSQNTPSLGGNTMDLNGSATVPMPLDNPPLASGSVPTFGTYPGLSKTNGPEPTTTLALHSVEMDRQNMQVFDAEETKIEWLANRKCLLTTLKWGVGDTENTTLLELRLDTLLNLAKGPVPFNVALLNQFTFWRADMVFEFVAVRNKFQSGRLGVTVAYASPEVLPADQNTYYNHILDFNDDSDKCALIVDYNAATEFLRTVEGPSPFAVQDYSLGNLSVFVANPLIAASNVEQEIDVLVFIHFRNVSLARPRAITPFTWNTSEPALTQLENIYTLTDDPLGTTLLTTDKKEKETDKIQPTTGKKEEKEVKKVEKELDGTEVTSELVSDDELELTSQGPTKDEPLMDNGNPEINIVADDDNSDLMLAPATTSETTLETSGERAQKPCRLEVGRKFEFCVADVLEVCRRGIPFTQAPISNQVKVGDNQTTFFFYDVAVRPRDRFRPLFRAWSGSLRYRLFLDQLKTVQCAFIPRINFEELGIATSPFKTNGAAINPLNNQKDFSIAGVANFGVSINGTANSHAIEVLFPNNGQSYIDADVPFSSHYNFLRPNALGSDVGSAYPRSTGNLVFEKSDPSTRDVSPYERFFIMAGDDFRYGCFAPPSTVTLTYDLQSVFAPDNTPIVVDVLGYRKQVLSTKAEQPTSTLGSG